LRSSVTGIRSTNHSASLTINGSEQQFDAVLLAAPFLGAARLLPHAPATDLQQKIERFDAPPIPGMPLRVDREITPLPHAVLLDRTIQWMFQKSKFQEPGYREGGGSYVELVVSASKSLVQKSREEVLELALRELAEFFPVVKEAKVLKAAVI